jgi:hypothetical protein
MANPNQSITMTNRQKWALESKSKQGWKCYFIERGHTHDIGEMVNTQRNMVRNIREGGEVDIEHLKNSFLELYTKVREFLDCPICYEPMMQENTHMPFCGHLICKGCKPRVTACPICRKDY